MEKPIRVEARLRNNILWHAIFDRWPTVAEFCSEHGFNQSDVGQLLNLKMPPVKNDGRYRKICLQLAEVFQLHEEDLFPPEIYGLKKIEAVMEIGVDELPDQSADHNLLTAPITPLEVMVQAELRDKIQEALAELTPIQRDMVIKLFGLDQEREWTIEEVAEDYLVTIGRVRKHVSDALRRLRHPLICERLKEFVEPD